MDKCSSMVYNELLQKRTKPDSAISRWKAELGVNQEKVWMKSKNLYIAARRNTTNAKIYYINGI